MAEGNGEKRKRSLSNKLQSRECEVSTKRLSFEKSEALFFSVEGLKRSESLNKEFVTKSNFKRPFEHPQSFSRALGKRSDRFVLCISTVNIYIYMFIYIRYIRVVFLTVAIASPSF